MIASEHYVRNIIENAYGVGSVLAFREVPSEADLTALVRTTKGAVVAKTTTDEFGRWSLTLQAQAQLRLREEMLLGDLIPKVIANADGQHLTLDGEATTMLMTFQKGTSIADVKLTKSLVQEVAYLQYQSAEQYAEFLPSVDMRAYPRPWSMGSFTAETYDLERHLGSDVLSLAADIFDEVAAVNQTHRADTGYNREQFIFGDFNLSNVLCTGGSISGLIDFGDAVMGTRLADIAIALCYLQLHSRGLDHDVLFKVYMAELAKYQSPPTADEMKDLRCLIRGRALMVLLNGREVATAEPLRRDYALRYDAAAAALLTA